MSRLKPRKRAGTNMKKLMNKVRRHKTKETSGAPERITNKTVAEHREQVLADGRKFKYPVQYAKYRLVVNSIILTVVSMVLLGILIWVLLYPMQLNTKFMYRVTQLLPVAVANVDGQDVRYSDYLRRYRADVVQLVQQDQINLKSVDGKRQSEYIKRRELDKAIRSAYVKKLAKQLNLKVTPVEVDDYITSSVNAKGISLDAYEKTVLREYYDWSLDDYRESVRAELLSRKVEFAIDKTAKQRALTLASRAQTEDFAALAKAESDDIGTKDKGGDVGVLPTDNLDVNGLIMAARRMSEGQVSQPIEGTDGYYIIKLIKKSEMNIHYAQIKVNLGELEKRFDAVKKSDKVKEYIDVSPLEN